VTDVVRMANATVSSPDAAAPPADALELAFARYQGELLGTLYYMVGNREDARDALQDTFIKCWRHREKLPEIDNLKAWIFRIALNTARDLRQTAWRRKRQSLPEGDTMTQTNQDSPDTLAEREEELGMVRRALHELRPEEQEVFLLRQNGAMTYEEISDAIGIPTGTVKTRMRLALSKLRQSLATR
jgi:RNA polymerase sigma factor (sigma-70 family)